MQKKTKHGGFSSKGYYIALGLCVVAIVITGVLYYQNGQEPQLQNPDTTLSATVAPGDLEVVATEPKATDGTETPTRPKPADGPLKTAAPVAGQTLMPYAMECLSYNPTTRDWRTHNGVDIAAEAGTFVTAAADGTVYTVYTDEKMGTTVVITHQDGFTTQYASLAENVLVKPGDSVRLGQQIGTVGNTALMECAIGDHVHFSVLQNDKPVDPADFLDSE